jgi:hypothetical protein
MQNPLTRENESLLRCSTGFRLGDARLCWSCLGICPNWTCESPSVAAPGKLETIYTKQRICY